MNKINPKIKEKINNIQEKISDDDSNALLEKSYREGILSVHEDLNDYISGNSRMTFSDIVGFIDKKIFDVLKQSVCREYDLVAGPHFLGCFYNYLNYIYFIKNYPKEVFKSRNKQVILSEEFSYDMDYFFKQLSYEELNILKQINKKISEFLRPKYQYFPMGYCSFADSLAEKLRNADDQHWAIGFLPEDYLTGDKDSYGNAIVASDIFKLCCYAYLEILSRWGKLIELSG